MDRYDELYNELCQISKEILPYYDIDKIKMYSVYIWTKGNGEDDYGENVFDIQKDKIVYYVKDHEIPNEVMSIIQKIQSKLVEISELESVYK